MSKKKLKDFFFASDEKMRNILDKTSLTHAIYEHVILPIEASIFKAGNYKISTRFRSELSNVRELYYTHEEKQNPKLARKLEKKLVKAHIAHRMKPEEYFLYGLRGKDYWEQKEYLSDVERKNIILRHGDPAVYEELNNKDVLYEHAKKYFRREACVIDTNASKSAFTDFALRHKKFFVKPIDGTWGRGASILMANTTAEAEAIFDKLSREGRWFVEELIKQVPETAMWNDTSVNTVRIPALYTRSGCKILQPFLRTGRKGAVVDNAGGGGIFAVFDAETGIITTDGVDEHGGRYERHPDSGIVYKGWQVPRYEELKALTAELLHALPSHPRYVAFDFALTAEGWVLVEGNYNGQFVGQMADHLGVRNEFLKYYLSDQP
ncbi:MAG: hypothetical protein IKX33_04780 [Prevotella sp.]|nr:hypothetical protein [Prevotella sp.]